MAREIQQMRDATISSGNKKYEIKSNVEREIQQIVNKISRYNNVNDFIDESLRNTINFWSQPESIQRMAGELWPSFTSEMKLEIKKTAPVFYHTMEASQERTKIKNMIFIKKIVAILLLGTLVGEIQPFNKPIVIKTS